MSCIAQPSSGGGEEKPRAMVSTPTGYCFSDAATSSTSNIQTHMSNSHLQGFEQNSEIYNLTTGMEMIGFPSKNPQQQSETCPVLWRGFFKQPGNHHPSSSKAINMDPSSSEFYQHDFSKPLSDTTSESLMVAAESTAAWQHRFLVDDQSLRCVFPCEGNERPSQGLSLSLSSSNPSSIGLQSFELRQHDDDMRFVASSSRDGFFSKPMNIQPQQQMMQDGLLGKAANLQYQSQFQIRNSKYLNPAQELLGEFCNLGTKQTDHGPSKIKLQKTNNQWQDNENSGSSSKKQSLYSLDLLELQKRKTKLLQMLEEVDRRYRHYCDQMKAVVSSFEAVAGKGAATVYSALASKAMSRHFRSLRDGIIDQIKATKKAMGEKDSTAAPGTLRGETPRLRILDQTLRQQRAFQQMSMMESHPWRPQRGLPERSVSLLRAWLFEHFLHPYPSDVDKHILARQTGLSRSQVSNWFINARVRLWKPMVEEMYLQEIKDQENRDSLDGHQAAMDDDDNDENGGLQNLNPDNHHLQNEDQKPTSDQLVRIDSECLSSIINNPEKIDPKNGKSIHESIHLDHSFGRPADTHSLGVMELDFSSFHQNSVTQFGNQNTHQNFGSGGGGGGAGGGGGGGGVSLTLGLQQHGGSGVSLAFSSSAQNSLFYSRDHIEDCPPIQYSLLENEGQNLPYRNLMGAQLLHDLAG